MTGASWKHYYEPLASTSLTADRPVDTFATRIAMDNVAHLVDSSPVYRINWYDPNGVRTQQYALFAGTQWQFGLYALEFPTTLLREGRHVGFDVRVAASITGGVTGVVSATIATPDVAYPVNDATGPGILGSTSLFFNNSDPAWVLETTFTGEGVSLTPQFGTMVCTNTSEYVTGSNASTGVGKLRAIIAVLGIWPNEDYSEKIVVYGIQVREYPIE